MTGSESFAGSAIENPASGEVIKIHTSAAESDGELLVWELWLRPGGRVPSGHTHPYQEERFTILRGHLRFRVGWRIRVVGPGETVTVPPGTPHHFANAGQSEAHVMVETRPALQMADLLEVAAKVAKDHRGNARRLPRPVELLLFMHEFRSEVQAPYLPARLVNLVVSVGVRLAVAMRLDRRYRRLRAHRLGVEHQGAQESSSTRTNASR
jgi:quercetin dioxygenase-like cupin family protein